ncbi:MAG: DUF4132 domain-containing protein, partial [Planctomycetota bacterium]
SAWVEEATATVDKQRYFEQLELKKLPEGMKILETKGESASRMVRAAVIQTLYWDQQAEVIKDQAETAMQRVNAHHLPGWGAVWGRRRQAAVVIHSLMRRKLPLSRDDFVAIMEWCNAYEGISPHHYPLSSIVRALERFCEQETADEAFQKTMRIFAGRLRECYDNKSARLGTNVEQLCTIKTDSDDEEPQAYLPTPQPTPIGDPCVLVKLKEYLGIGEGESELNTLESAGPDAFPLATNSPLFAEHELISQLLEEVVGSPDFYQPKINKLKTGKLLLKRDLEAAGRSILAAAERHIHALMSYEDGHWQAHQAAVGIVEPLVKIPFTLSRDHMFDFVLYLAARPAHVKLPIDSFITYLVNLVDGDDPAEPISEGERYALSLYRASLVSGPLLGNPSPDVAYFTKLVGDGMNFCLEPGEAWTDAVNADFTAMKSTERDSVATLFTHLLTATSSRPSKKWVKKTGDLVQDIGEKKVHGWLEKWLPVVSQGRSLGKLGSYSGDARGAADTMDPENANALRGLLWLIPTLKSGNSLVRQITAVAISAYKKVPGVGPRAVKVGNAAVYALSQLAAEDAVGQLAMLKVRVKFGTAQKEIEKAFTVAAEALGLERDEIEEMGVPSYGLGSQGILQETLGDYQARLSVTGSDAHLNWMDAKGKTLKSVPAKVRREHKDELKELKQSLKDIQGMLPAQRDRIDSMFLLQKSWPIDQWRERYLDHPLVGTIASRLLWCVDGTASIFIDGVPTDVDGDTIEHGKTAEITLWHPVGQSVEQITGWRQRLESLQLTQPFKQAHRELYLLTEAERNTNTYSNRYAAHILRQHQFNALCAARGWKNRLRLMVDDTLPPATKELPSWGLRAEFWVEGIGDEYGSDTNDTGVFLRLATDQVRFYRTEAATNYAHVSGGGYTTAAAGSGRNNVNEPIPLEEVPPLVFSEIMRDVDLFVGVASVGNDPTWQDGGPEGRFLDYWNSYSFGELSGSASTRREVLQRLVPRLRIADQCSFSDRFLIVEGKKRTYKIHLGSGNILMEPNDQYLCIVPDAKSRSKRDDLFLPFEGDSTLSIILSKAFLLAEDNKIKDPTITCQINLG